MQFARFTDPQRVRIARAMVFRGDSDTVDPVFNEHRFTCGIEVIYVRTGAGRLRIVSEEKGRP